MDQELERMAERVGRGLKNRDLSAQTVTIKVRYGDFTTLTRSYTLPSPTSDEQVMATWAYRLLRKTEAGRRSVRLLGLGAGNLVHGEMSQLELF
jgi:DNA polymerase-4